MKKSKLIVPAALAVMLLSTAASVTGTVAWFTSNRAVNTEVSSFTASSIGGNLNLTMGAGIGTQLGTGESANVLSVKSGVKLTDGSFDASTGTLYRTPYKSNEPANAGDKFVALTTASDKSTGENPTDGTYTRTVGTTVYYFAVTWTMTFTYSFQGDTTAVNLYFNVDGQETVGESTVKKSRITYSQAVAPNGTHTEQTYKGFRIAFVGSTNSSSKLLWAPEQTAANAKRISAVTDNPTGVAQASTTKVIGSDTTSGILASNQETGGTTVSNYLGQFTTTNTSIALNCTAWFEGTDANVINEAEMDTVTAKMHFFVATNA